MTQRRYLTTHPWLTFDLTEPSDALNSRLTEAYELCRDLGTTPEPAESVQQSLVKTTRAITAIEGNTLTEAEVAAVLAGNEKVVAPWQGYLRADVENVGGVLRSIDADAQRADGWRPTPAWIKAQNAAILHGIAEVKHVVPGEYTQKQLPAGNARQSAPPDDVPHLVDRLCDWLNAMLTDTDDRLGAGFARTFRAAVLGHVYVAGIYPFGGGNRRTAKVLEFAVLAHSRLLPRAANGLLSEHYQRTAQRYYAMLDAALGNGEMAEFVQYAADGFVDQLKLQLSAAAVSD